MTLERGVALIATHLGIVDEEAINNMSLLFFESVLEELGKKLNYDAVSNYAGNSFCNKSWEMIQKAHPMNANPEKVGASAVASFFENANIIVKRTADNAEDIGPRKKE